MKANQENTLEEVKLPKELEEIILRHFERQHDEFGDIDDYWDERPSERATEIK